MYKLIVTDDFINTLKNIPLKYVGILEQSFLSLSKLNWEEIPKNVDDNSLLLEMLKNIKNKGE